MLNPIKSVSDVEQFKKLPVEEYTNLHPDYNFPEFIHFNNGEPSFSIEKSKHRNWLMNHTFEDCETKKAHICEVIQRVLLIETRLDKVIPLC